MKTEKTFYIHIENIFNQATMKIKDSNPLPSGFWSSSDNLGNLITGLILFLICGLITFFIKEIIKKPPSFNGAFYLKTVTTNSSYIPYTGLSSFYVMTLISESSIKAGGRIEKIYDIENSGFKRIYTGTQRNTGEVLLSIERNYLRRNKLVIHVNFNGDKDGHQRESSMFMNFRKAKINSSGTFITTAADSRGDVFIQDEKF